jgi:lauroyl/myristoyl acyltransferase
VTLPGGFTEFSGAILLLALSRNCPVIPVTTNRLPDGTFRVEAHPPFFVERDGRNTTALLDDYCQRLADVFVPVIQKNPDQWFHFVPVARP